MNDFVDPRSAPGAPGRAPVAVTRVDRVLSGSSPTGALTRARQHTVIVPRPGSGRSRHIVDFTTVDLDERVVLHIQPGQVHRHDPKSPIHGDIVTVSGRATPPLLFAPSVLVPRVPLGPSVEIVRAVTCDLGAELASPSPCEGVLISGAGLLLHHIARSATELQPSRSAHSALLDQFRIELERRFAESRNVSSYARSIGTSTKTLARATTQLTGRAPKELIDQRVSLEAKRLLALSGEPIASIGVSLGFSEATNFTKFFLRLTGHTPHEFRDAHP